MDIISLLLISISLLASVSSLPRSFQKNKSGCLQNMDCDRNEQCVNNKCKQKVRENDDINELIKESYCITSQDCVSTYTCNTVTHTCEQITDITQIWNKQACKHVFKKRCMTSKQCGCDEEKMICEENECVYQKENNEKENLKDTCNWHLDCPTAFLCDYGKCREAKNFQELMMILIEPEQKCQINGDCDKNKHEVCTDGICRKKKKSDSKRSKRRSIKKCIKNTIDNICETSKDCNSKCGKKVHRMTCSNNKCKLLKKKNKSRKKKKSTEFKLLKTFSTESSI